MELRKVCKWLEANRLVLNIEKINFGIFHSQQRIITDHIVLEIGEKRSNKSTVSVFRCAVRFYLELEEPSDRTI